MLTSYLYRVTPKKVTPSDQAQNEQQKRTPQNCCALHTRPNRSTPLGSPGTIGYKVTKKIIHFSKHYLVISYDQRYSKSYFNVIRRNSYVSIKLIWKEPPPPCNHVRQKSTGFVYRYLERVSGNSTFQKLHIASNRFI